MIKHDPLDRRNFLAGSVAAAGAAITGVMIPAKGCPVAHVYNGIKVVDLDESDLQNSINEAAPHSLLFCKSEQPIIVHKTIVIRKPITLIGLHAQLREGLANTPMISVEAEGVVIKDFELKGNSLSVRYSDRASLIKISAGHFRIEDGKVFESSQHGVHVISDRGGDVRYGLVRNIAGFRINQDVVSLEGAGHHGHYVRNIMVENVWAKGPSQRGAVESCDGTRNITIRNIYAETCAYGVDVQDHNRRGQTNKDITIDGVHTNNCLCSIITQNRPFGHTNLSIRNVTGENWPDQRWRHHRRVTIRNTSGVILENVRVSGNRNDEDVIIRNCDGLTVRNLLIENADHKEPAVLIYNCQNVCVNNVMLVNAADKLESVLHYQISQGFKQSVQITNVSAPELKRGIIISRTNTNTTLKNYLVRNNLTGIVDHINDRTAIIGDNLFSD